MSAALRTIIAWFCVIALISQSGCAHSPKPPLPDEVRAQLGTVGIAAAKPRPEAALDIPAKGWLAGAGRKSARWAGKGALGPLQAPSGCGGDRSGLCALLIIAFSVTAGTIGGLAGGVVGAFQAEPSKKVGFAEEVITTVIDSLKMPEALRDRVAQVARSRTGDRMVVVPNQGPPGTEENNPYGYLAEKGIDTVLEIAIPRFALAGESDINPPLEFQMNSLIRLIRTTNGKVLYETSIDYRGSSMIFYGWVDNNAQPFFEELETAYQFLAERIVAEVFMLTPQSAPEQSGGEDPGETSR